GTVPVGRQMLPSAQASKDSPIRMPKIAFQRSCMTVTDASHGAAALAMARPLANVLMPVNLPGPGLIRLIITRAPVMKDAPPSAITIRPIRHCMGDAADPAIAPPTT